MTELEVSALPPLVGSTLVKTEWGDIEIAPSIFDTEYSLLLKRSLLTPEIKNEDYKVLETPTLMIYLGQLRSSAHNQPQYFDISKFLYVAFSKKKPTPDDVPIFWKQLNQIFKTRTGEFTPESYSLIFARLFNVLYNEYIPFTVFNDFVYDISAKRPFTGDELMISNAIELGKLLEAQFDNVKRIQNDQNILQSQSNPFPGNFIISSANYTFNLHPAFDPVTFFNNQIPDRTMDTMAYIDSSEYPRIKFWKYSTLDPLEESKLKRRNRLLLRLLAGGSFNLVDINIKTRLLKVTISIQLINSLTQRLNELKIIQGDAKLSNVTGSVIFSNLTKPIIKRSFLYFLFASKLAYSFIRPDDQKITNFIKGRSILRYKPLTYDEREDDVKVGVSWKQTSQTQFEMKLARIKNLDDIKIFIGIVGRLISSYIYEQESIERMFSDVLGNNVPQTEIAQWDNLNSIAPEIFGPNYGKIVSEKAFPMIVSDIRLVPQGVPVTNFIYDKYNLLLIPSHPDTHPYFGIKMNRRYPSEKPYLPAYFKAPQLTNEKSTLLGRLLGIPLVKQRKSTKKESTTDNNILDYGKFGVLPTSITTFLSNPDYESIVRVGITHNPANIVSAVLMAKDWDKYYTRVMRTSAAASGNANLAKTLDKDTLAELGEIRREMSFYESKRKTIHPEVAKQELYNLTSDQIRERLRRTIETFNTTGTENMFGVDFYRIVEEHFDINIFFFQRTDRNTVVMFTPSHMDYHIKLIDPRRKSVIIYLQPSGEMELVIYRKSTGESGIFDTDVTELLLNAYKRVSSRDLLTSEMEYIPDEAFNLDYSFLGDTTSGRLPTNTQTNVSGRTSTRGFQSMGTPVAQIIDTHGKRVGMILSIPHTNDKFTVYFQPRAPLNLPEAKTEAYASFKYFPFDPTSKTQRGFWFGAYGISDAFFIPLHPEDMKLLRNVNVPLGKQPPLAPDAKWRLGVGSRTQIIKINADILKDVVRWLFVLGGGSSTSTSTLTSSTSNNTLIPITSIAQTRVSTFTPSTTVQEFTNAVFSIITTDLDDSQLYKFDNLPSEVPNLNLPQALDYLETKVPTLVKSRKVLLTDKLSTALIQYLKSLIEPKIPVQFNTSEIKLASMITDPTVISIDGSERYSAWLRERANQTSNYVIPWIKGIPSTTLPGRLLLDVQNKYYMIDVAKNIDEAVELVGAKRYLVYQPAPNAALQVIVNKTDGQVPYTEFLRHIDRPMVSLMVRVG